jgi:hypothetical protein
MTRFATLFAAICVLAVGLPTANAAVIVNDTFETYTSQANFEGTWAPIGTVAPTSGEWSTAQASSPTHSVRQPGTATNSQSRNQLTFAETGSVSAAGNKIVWSFDFYDSNPAGAPQRNHTNLQDSTAASATNQLIAMGLNNNQTAANSGGNYYMGRILGFTHPGVDPDGGPAESVVGAGAFFKLNDFANAPLRSLGWHNLKVILSTNDGNSTDFEFYVDNILSERVNNVGTAASIRSYDVIRIGSGLSNGGIEAFVDNMYLEFIPANTNPTVVDHVVGPPYNANSPGSVTHNFVATDAETPGGPFTWDQLTFMGYTPNYGGTGPGPANNPTLSGAGQFNWNSVGSPRGDYVWRVRATDPQGGTDQGTITVHVTNVPEPVSLALVGLGLFGLGLATSRRIV